MNHSPAEKVIDIDYDRFYGRTRTGEPLHGNFGVLQPFGIGCEIRLKPDAVPGEAGHRSDPKPDTRH
jgi:hypothetical protein